MITPSGISHSYDQGIAIGCKSVIAAIVYNHICFWIKHNIIEGHEPINGRNWMWQSIPKIRGYLPEFSEPQIRDALQILVQKKLIVKDSFNKDKFDRKSWYALPDESILNIENSKNLFDKTCRSDREVPQVSSTNYIEDKKVLDITDVATPSKEKIFVSPDLEPEDAKKGTIKMPQAKWDAFVAEHGEARVKRCARELSNYIVSKSHTYKKHYLALATFIKNDIEREQAQKSKEIRDKKFDWKNPEGIGEQSFRPKSLEERFREEDELAEKEAKKS